MEENRELIHTYEIFKKDFNKAIPRWKVPEEIKWGRDKINSLEDVADYLSRYYPERQWKLVKENITKKATIYDFECVDSPNSNKARYTLHIIKVKIISKISLENKLGEDKK